MVLLIPKRESKFNLKTKIMATTKQMMRGKVGNLIFYEVNGTTRVRSVPLEYRDANTESQRQTRRRLVVAVRFYQHLKETLLWRVWREAARGEAASGYALFLKRNVHVFNDRTLEDTERLVVSEGKLPAMNGLRLIGREGGIVRLAWDNSLDAVRVHSADRLRVVALFEGRLFSPVWIEGVNARRCDRSAVVDLGRAGTGAHLYCFFESPEGRDFSPSCYLYAEGGA